MYMCTYLHVIEPTYDQFRDDNQDMVSRCPSCSYIATTNLQLCHFLILQLFTLFDGLGSVLGSKEVADKAIAAYTEKRENVGKWFEEAIMEGNGLVEIFKKSSIDQGEPANRVKEEMDKLQASMPEAQFEHGRYRRAASLLDELVSAQDEFVEFLTLPGYQLMD